MIKYEERDIFLNQEYKHQLRIRLENFQVPAIFVDGKHIGVSAILSWAILSAAQRPLQRVAN